MEILHLEDDGPLREIMSIALSAADPKLKMKQFTDSDNAMRYIEQHVDAITLYVLDVRVPGELDGLGVAQRIRQLGSTRPILVTSAYRKPDQDRLSEYNCQWMAKPWHLLDAPQTILLLARDDNEDNVADTQLKSTYQSEALRPKPKSARKDNTRPIYSQQAPSQRRQLNDEELAAKSYVEELAQIMESDTHSMEAIRVDEEPVKFDNVLAPVDEKADTEPVIPPMPENPIPFDEPLALLDADALHDHTDLIVTIARQEGHILKPTLDDDLFDAADVAPAAPEIDNNPVYKSADAPEVEPYSDEDDS